MKQGLTSMKIQQPQPQIKKFNKQRIYPFEPLEVEKQKNMLEPPSQCMINVMLCTPRKKSNFPTKQQVMYSSKRQREKTARCCLFDLYQQQKKKRNIYAKNNFDICPICIEEITETHAVTECKHKFCNSCMRQTIAKSDKCPLCRTKMSHVYIENQKTEVRQIVAEEHHISHYLNQSELLQNPCYFCGQFAPYESLILCGRCTQYCVHDFCDQQLLGNLDQLWICAYCKNRENPNPYFSQ